MAGHIFRAGICAREKQNLSGKPPELVEIGIKLAVLGQLIVRILTTYCILTFDMAQLTTHVVLLWVLGCWNYRLQCAEVRFSSSAVSC